MPHWSEPQQSVVSPIDAIAEVDRQIKGIEDEKKRRTLNKIDNFFPDTGEFRRELYPKHLEFFRAGRYYRSRMFSAGNRCLLGSSVLEVSGPMLCRPERTVGEILHAGNSPQVIASWQDGSKCWRPASSIFLKGFGPAVRLHLSNGQTFDCGLGHEVMDARGVFRPVYAFGPEDPTAVGTRIERQEDLPDQVILDITVPSTNCYISQGLVSHNCGKTVAGAYETALHLGGIYPDWWEGRRFEGPISAWACGVSNETTKNVVQAELLGRLEKDEVVSEGMIGMGTGMIPAHLIAGVEFHAQIRGAVKTAWIKHVSGRRSMLGFKSYEQGSTAFEGTAMDWVWMDESADLEIYTECLMRTMTGQGGEIIITATPLNGLTDLVMQFMPDGVVPETQVAV